MTTLTAKSQSSAQADNNTAPSDPSQEAILCEFLPSTTLRQYHALKIILALMLSSIFAWWIYVNQGSYSTAMYLALATVALITIWVTFTSVNGESARDKNRQITITQNTLIIQADNKITNINKNDINHAIWHQDTFQNQGLHIISKQGQTIGHIDGQVLSNQEDARRFLRWLRNDGNINFDVQWNA